MQTLESPSLKNDTISVRLLTQYLSTLENMAGQEPAPAAETGDSEDGSRVRWAPRIRMIEGIEPEQLSSAHGRLIAQGLLHFQVEDRSSGLCYRVSPEGRTALATVNDGE